MYISEPPVFTSQRSTNFYQFTSDIHTIKRSNRQKVYKAKVMLQLAYETKRIMDQNVTKAAGGFVRCSIKCKFPASIWSIVVRWLTIGELYQRKVVRALEID